MAEFNLFEWATRAQPTFQTSRGPLMVEDLWDLPLKGATGANLNRLALDLRDQLGSGNQSLVPGDVDAVDVEVQRKFEIVMHIMQTKVDETTAAKTEFEKQQRRRKILTLLAEARDKDLASKSPAELEQILVDEGL